MRIFNRNKDNEINELKTTTDKLTEDNNKIQKEITNQQDITNELSNAVDSLTTKIMGLETLVEKLQTKIGLLQAENNELDKKYKTILKKQEKILNKELEKIKDKENNAPQITPPQINDNHLYKINRANIPNYKPPVLKGERLKSGKRYFSFNITTVINIKNNLQKYYNNGLTVKEIGEKYDLSNETVSTLIWNIEEGVFDEVISEYENNTATLTRDVGESYHFEYNDLKLVDDKVYYNNKKKPLKYDIREIRLIKERMNDFDKYPTFKSLFKGMKFRDYPSKVLIYNIELGKFDKLIEEYILHEPSHERNVAPSLRKKYDNIILAPNGALKSNGHVLKFKIQDVIKLKNNINDFVKYPTMTSLINSMGLSWGTTSTLIWNIEEGVFDELIEKWENGDKDNLNTKYHIYTVSKSYQHLIKNPILKDNGDIHASNNLKLPYTIYNIIELKKRIYSGTYDKIQDLYSDFGFAFQLGNKLVWNIEEGVFDDLIEEFQSRRYTYERRYNNLYINGEDTHLTIEKCNLIIDCLVNDPNKYDTINRLIKNYPQTEPKYIRILGEEYNNVNLSKVLKKEKVKVEAVNDPQKRREQGYY